MLINDKGELNSSGAEKLKAYFKRYQDPKNVNNISQANIEMENVKIDMNNNIKNLLSNVSDLNVGSVFIPRNSTRKEGNSRKAVLPFRTTRGN